MRRSAAFAAVAADRGGQRLSKSIGQTRTRTCLVRIDVLPRYLLLLLYLASQVDLALLQHLELRPQVQNDLLRRVFPLLRGAPAEPAPDSRHGGFSKISDGDAGGRRVSRVDIGGRRVELIRRASGLALVQGPGDRSALPMTLHQGFGGVPTYPQATSQKQTSCGVKRGQDVSLDESVCRKGCRK